MKIFFKVFIIFVIISMSFNFIIIAFIMFGTLPSALKETNISFIQLIKDDLSEDEYVLLSEYTSSKAAALGSDVGKKLVIMLGHLFSIDDVEAYTEKETINYSIETLDQIMHENEKLAEKAIKDSLNDMREHEKNLHKIREESLNSIQN